METLETTWIPCLPKEDLEQFILELRQTLQEVAKNGDTSKAEELLDDWEETAYIYAHPELKREIDASIAEARAGKAKPVRP